MDVHNPYGPVWPVLFLLLNRSGNHLLSMTHEFSEKKMETISSAVIRAKAIGILMSLSPFYFQSRHPPLRD